MSPDEMPQGMQADGSDSDAAMGHEQHGDHEHGHGHGHGHGHAEEPEPVDPAAAAMGWAVAGEDSQPQVTMPGSAPWQLPATLPAAHAKALGESLIRIAEVAEEVAEFRKLLRRFAPDMSADVERALVMGYAAEIGENSNREQRRKLLDPFGGVWGGL